MIWTFQKHQIVGAEWALATVRKYGLAYLSWQERTRKSGTALLAIEKSKAKRCLIITKKKAIPGWQEHLDNHLLTKEYQIINYESAHKVVWDFDMVILDESHHAISGFPKRSKTWLTIAKLCKGKPIIYLSATPYAEHLGLIYHQLKISKWTPFKDTNGYDFFRRYGIPHKTRTPYGLQESYSKFQNEKILAKMIHLFDYKTRADVGIEHEPTVKVVVVELSDKNKAWMAEWSKHRVIEINGEMIAGDSDPKMRTIHYQLEGGTAKVNDYLTIRTGELEKIDYIKANYNLADIAIMAHFIEERALLKEHFPTVPIYSSDGDAEGVDLSHISKLLVYSMSFKTSKHTQRVARQANHDRTKPIEVDVLVAKAPGIGYKVYNTVAIKKINFTKLSYEL